MIWGPPYPSALCPAQALRAQMLPQAPRGSAKGLPWADVTPWPGPQDRATGQSHPSFHHLWDAPTTKSPLQFRHSFHPLLLLHGANAGVPPKKHPTFVAFTSPYIGSETTQAAPCSPLRDPGPWPRFSPSFFYNSVLISPWLEEATHLLKAFSELRMKSETEAPSAAP